MINTKTGVLEIKSDIDKVINKLAKIIESNDPNHIVKIGVVRNSKNHKGKTMLVIYEQQWIGSPINDWDISIYNLEVSSLGIFAYIVDDGVS
jgi:hypothetical protein